MRCISLTTPDFGRSSLCAQMRLPDRVEPYIHRAGRTGRLQRPGKVVTFTTPEEAFVTKRFSNDIGVSIHERKLRSVVRS
jgi:superfamily II DNA/RNA helicase